MRYIKNFSTVVCFFIIINSCAQLKGKINNTSVIEVTLDDFGKSKPLSSQFYQVTKIQKKHVTSAFYVYSKKESKIKSLPINDRLFNYDYFNENIYPNIQGRKVKLTIKKYLIEEKEIFVVIKIK